MLYKGLCGNANISIYYLLPSDSNWNITKSYKISVLVCTQRNCPKLDPNNYMPYLKAAKKKHDQFIYPVIFWGFWNFWGKKSAFLVGKIPSSTGSRGPQSRGRLKIRSSPPLQLPISEAMEPSRPSPGTREGAAWYRNVVLEHMGWFRLKWIQNA